MGIPLATPLLFFFLFPPPLSLPSVRTVRAALRATFFSPPVGVDGDPWKCGVGGSAERGLSLVAMQGKPQLCAASFNYEYGSPGCFPPGDDAVGFIPPKVSVKCLFDLIERVAFYPLPPPHYLHISTRK